MIPVRTNASNVVYKGDEANGVGDAYVQRLRPGVVSMTWVPTDEERAAIAAGALVELVIFAEPIPPTLVMVSKRVPLSDQGAALRDRAVKVIALTFPDNPDGLPPGWWVASKDVATDLVRYGALDPSDLPEDDRPLILFGRGVMVDEEHAGHGKLVYQQALALPTAGKLS